MTGHRAAWGGEPDERVDRTRPRSRVPRIAEAAVERARLTVVPRARRPRRAARAVRGAGVAAARRRRRRAAAVQHLDAAGVLHRDRAGGAGRGARRPASSRCRWSSTSCATRSGSPPRAKDMGMVPPTSPGVHPALRRQGARHADARRRTDDGMRVTPAADPQAEEPAAHADRRSRCGSRRIAADGAAARQTRRTHARRYKEVRRTATGSRGASVDPGQPTPARGTRAGRRSASRRPRLRVAARCVAGPAADRLPPDRDGGLGVRRPAVPAAGRRRRRRTSRRRAPRASSRSTLPATRGRSRTATACRSPSRVDGLMIVADPTADREARAARSPRSSPAASTSTTSTLLGRLRKPDTHFQYLARRVPVDGGQRGRRRAIDAPRLQGHRHPPRPGADLPGRRRRAPTWSAS